VQKLSKLVRVLIGIVETIAEQKILPARRTTGDQFVFL
jgi:hypothetical protein